MNLFGGINFRDLGGLPTLCGRRLRQGRIFRSGALGQLTQEDRAQLEAHRVAHILDYRDHHEAKKDQNVEIGGAQYEVVPAMPRSHAVAAGGDAFFTDQNLKNLPKDFMESFYRALPFQNQAYRRLFQVLENLKEGAIVHHCAVGKDRTGVASALILSALQVPRELIVADYLKTQETLKPHHDRMKAKHAPHLSLESQEMFLHVMSAKREFLESAFSEVERRYKDMNEYFHIEFGLEPTRIKRFRDLFLE
jgi:protein-tyrosine phosphatase